MNNLKHSRLLLLIFLSGLQGFSQNPEINGQWSAPIPFDIVPVAVANLPDGRLLTWSSKAHNTFGGGDGFTFTQIFDPSIGLDGGTLPSTITQTNHDMFCPGTNNLADGRILVTGGSSNKRSSIYDPETNIWTAAGNMNKGRGYQGAVTLSDGSAFLIGGSWSGGVGDKDAELWTEATGWQTLTGIPNELLWNANDFVNEPQGVKKLDNHAWLWAGPNGKVFHAGPGETMHWFDVSGNGSSIDVGPRGDDVFAINGQTVMFDIGKILKFGGSNTHESNSPASNKTYVIDINDENNVTVTPVDTLLGDVPAPRVYTTGVVLPNGETMILGGMNRAKIFTDNGALLSTEIYNPETNSIRTVSSMQIPRTYHSTGILLNDGRVFFGGGGLCNNCGNKNHPDAEVYSPPYLFDSNGDLAIRPTLEAPGAAYYSTILPVVASTEVTEFVFIRSSSATHSINNEQRRVPLDHTGTNGNYQIDIPDANLMPPGYYMLFALNANGVPSVSKTVMVGQPEDRIMETNLLVEYDFFEGNGSTITDTSGLENDSQILEFDATGSPVLPDAVDYLNYWNTDGFRGSAIQISENELNSSSILELPASSSLAQLANQITVMAWVNRSEVVLVDNDANTKGTIFAHDYPSFFLGYNDSQYELTFATDSGAQVNCISGSFSANKWEHIVATYDGNHARLYVNGEEICSSAITGNLAVNTSDALYENFTISSFYNSAGILGQLIGGIDKFKLYNAALSVEDIQTIYDDEKLKVTHTSQDNLALNKPTSQSSVSNGGVSSRAVDGNVDGVYNNNSITHTEDGAPEESWWRVDLQDANEYDVTSIRIFNRTDCCRSRLQGAEVYIGNVDSTNPDDYNLVKTLNDKHTQLLTQNLGSARYIMIRKIGVLSLAEVRVFGNIINEAPVTYTYDGDWFPSNPNITAKVNDDLVINSGSAEISTDIVCNTITVNAEGALTVGTTVRLTANSTTLKSTSESFSSLIADGSVAGDLRYERYVNANSNGNDLIAPPLAGQLWSNFIASNNNAAHLVNNGETDPTVYLFGPFDKEVSWYVNYSDAESAALTLNSGTGYRAGTVDEGATLTFTGTVPSNSIAIDVLNSGTSFSDWNLIGNPYPSYVNIKDFLNYEVAPGVKNRDLFQDASGIYGYDGNASDGWDVITLANVSNRLMAPGQGFLISADADNVAPYDVTFDASMQERRQPGGGDFIVGRNADDLIFLKLNLSSIQKKYRTEFYFNAQSTLGLDLGYDGKILGGSAPGFAVYSHLVQDNAGVPMALQSLNTADLMDILIPLGVNADRGEQITFNITDSNLPSDVDVYLEDNVMNTITLLNAGSYTITPSVDLNGTGRFYLRLSSETLSTVSNELDQLQIYTTTQPKSLVVEGELNGASLLNLYDIQGREVLQVVLDQFQRSNKVDISSIVTGVYVVKISANDQVKTQKLIIK